MDLKVGFTSRQHLSRLPDRWQKTHHQDATLRTPLGFDYVHCFADEGHVLNTHGFTSGMGRLMEVISFVVLSLKGWPDRSLRRVVQLIPNDWDDYSYKTLFALHYIDADGKEIQLGSVKIGYVGQEKGWTKDRLNNRFISLNDGWFSLGQDVDYYQRAMSQINDEDRAVILNGLRDIAWSEAAYKEAVSEAVFENSLLRNVSESIITGQYRRVVTGGTLLTDFKFSYKDSGAEKRSSVALDFDVVAGSKPPTNVHVLIGRNGIGKTTILNGMVKAVHSAYAPVRTGSFFSAKTMFSENILPADYFGSVVSVSFSVFDPFVPPPDNVSPTRGPKYFYIGMKKERAEFGATAAGVLKSEDDLVEDFILGFDVCMSQEAKRLRWLRAIKRLSSDSNFADMKLDNLAEEAFQDRTLASGSARRRIKLMSSGHKIVLLTITALVSLVEEKTLLLMDEPESHLHPPLLSAFTRALSELLHDRNGVAIIATHSPVVVQEVPKNCVWKLNRSGLDWRKDRPLRETFAENVGLLTSEVFGLEVSKAGFHALLQKEVDRGEDYDSILNLFGQRIGVEGKVILMAMIASREVDSGARL